MTELYYPRVEVKARMPVGQPERERERERDRDRDRETETER